MEDNREVNFSGRYNSVLVPLLQGIKIDTINSIVSSYDFIITPSEIKFREVFSETGKALPGEYIPLENEDYDIKLRQKGQAIQITYRPRSIAGNPVAGYQKEFVLISRDRNGGLFVEKVAEVYGMAFMIFPVAAKERSCFLFNEGKVEFLENCN